MDLPMNDFFANLLFSLFDESILIIWDEGVVWWNFSILCWWLVIFHANTAAALKRSAGQALQTGFGGQSAAVAIVVLVVIVVVVRLFVTVIIVLRDIGPRVAASANECDCRKGHDQIPQQS